MGHGLCEMMENCQSICSPSISAVVRCAKASSYHWVIRQAAEAVVGGRKFAMNGLSVVIQTIFQAKRNVPSYIHNLIPHLLRHPSIHPYHQAMGVILNTWRVYWQSQEGDNSHVGHQTIFVMRHTETDKKRGRQWRVFLKVKRFIATVVSSHDNVNWLAICPLTGVVLVGRVSSG